jgi:hypothetical protein
MTSNAFFSERFSKPVVLTYHAIEQMKERGVDNHTLFDLLESGRSI